MIYFGQEVGEDGSEDAGFGKPSRTSIFDYIGVPAHQRWMNNKLFDGGGLSQDEKKLRDFYQRLLSFTTKSAALMGQYREVHYYNKEHTPTYDHRIFSFVRWDESEKLVIISNFDTEMSYDLDFKLPPDLVKEWWLEDKVVLKEQLYGDTKTLLVNEKGEGNVSLRLEPLQSYIFKLGK